MSNGPPGQNGRAGGGVGERFDAKLAIKFSGQDIGRIHEFSGAKYQHPAFSNVRIHANGNNLAIIPSWLDKRHAVEHLIKQYRARTNALITFGMGDSLIDLGFMGSCDYILTPGTSQIAATLQQAQP